MATQLFEVDAPDVVYLVDLSSYLLRAYHAVAPLSSPKGEPTHAVHGMVTMLDRLFRDRKPKLVAIAMDSGRATFRKDIFPDYKVNRPPAPDDLRVQMRRAEELVRAWGLAVFKQEGVEADDLIASVVQKCKSQEQRVVIVSADKDLMQLVGPDVLMWDTLRNKVFGTAEVEERFGVSPQQLGDLLALTGDSSDNIPGVPSVGPKTAATLLNEYQNLDGIYANLAAVKRKKLLDVLSEFEAQARLSRRLVELKSDCPVDVSSTHLSFHELTNRDEVKLAKLYEELGFVRQLAALRALNTATSNEVTPASVQKQQAQSDAATDAKAFLSESDAELAKISISAHSNVTDQSTDQSLNIVVDEAALTLLIDLLKAETFSFELYTVRPDHHCGPPLGLGLHSESQAFYIPFGHRYVGVPAQLSAKDTLSRIVRAMEQNRGGQSVYQLKRQLVLLRGAGIEFQFPRAFDVMLGSYLLDPERSHKLEALATHAGIHVPEYDEATKEGRKKRTWDELEVADAARLSSQRTWAVLRSKELQLKQLQNLNLLDLLNNVELPLARELADLEVRGVLVDTGVLAELGKECAVLLSGLAAEAKQAAQRDFNVNSPRQLEEILFDDLGLKPVKRTKTARSTDAQTLEALTELHPLPGIILKLRQIAKLQGTYIEALPLLIDQHSGRIHGSWEQAVAATGRLSSIDPNLQNIPIRSELGRRIRDAFIAPPGHQLVSADYSQIELRVLAHLSQDQRLVEAFQSEQDVHLRTAMEIFDLKESEVTREHRSRAKAVNFGVIYGQGESALAKSLGIEKSEAARFIKTYFIRYEGVKSFMEATLEMARTGQAVQSLLGRRRIIPDILSGNRARRLAAERIAMNMPIQGSAADILKLAMLKFVTPPTPGTKMVLTVHDELVFEVPDLEVEDAKIKIKKLMESAYQLSVPLTVDVGCGANWNAAH